MSWASRRRTTYGIGALVFLLIIIGGPLAYRYLTIPATCTDGKQNGGETAIDKGGPCPVLDERALSPYGLLWTRSFHVRDGSYNAVAYIANPNQAAGVRAVGYKFSLYDASNILVAERTGATFLMPGTITPIFEGAINTGERIVAHTHFEFTSKLTWERLDDTSNIVKISDRETTLGETPRITAKVTNTSVKDMKNLTFIVTVSDPSGNAFAASQTTVSLLPGGESTQIDFSWPDAFNIPIGTIDITTLSAPLAPRAS